MVTIVCAQISTPSARLIAEAGGESFTITRHPSGDINWGQRRAATRLNPDITSAVNKRVMRELFRDNGVPMPRLLSVEEAREAVNSGQTVLGRPDRHWKGRGFWKCVNGAQIDRALRGTAKKKPATHFMEFIDPERTPYEFRAHIFQGKSIRISQKDHTAFHEYTTVRPSIDYTHVRQAAKQALSATGLDFGAVDILASETEAFALEVNTAPGLGGSMPRVYANTFAQWAEENPSD